MLIKILKWIYILIELFVKNTLNQATKIILKLIKIIFVNFIILCNL
jgi:hypothetical protein